MLVRHVVGHSRPASVALTFVFFLCRYCFVTRKPFKPGRVCEIALVGGIRFQTLFPTGCHSLSGNSVVRAFMPATGARPKAAKINLMDCSCLCSKLKELPLACRMKPKGLPLVNNATAKSFN